MYLDDTEPMTWKILSTYNDEVENRIDMRRNQDWDILQTCTSIIGLQINNVKFQVTTWLRQVTRLAGTPEVGSWFTWPDKAGGVQLDRTCLICKDLTYMTQMPEIVNIIGKLNEGGVIQHPRTPRPACLGPTACYNTVITARFVTIGILAFRGPC